MTMLIRQDVLLDQNNAPISGAQIYVYVQDGITNNTLATLTSDGTTALANPVISDAFGNFKYYANTGYYIEDIWFGGRRIWKNSNVAVGQPGADLTLRANLAASGGFSLVNQKPAGAVGDGATNDTTAISAADSGAGHKFLPDGTYLTSIAPTAIKGPFWGYGQIEDSAGNKRGPWFTAISAAPIAGNQNDISTFFNGDISKVLLPIEHRVPSGLTPPGTGYKYYPEASAIMAVSRNTSGGNTSTSSNDGRTNVVFLYGKGEQYGGGDHTFLSIQGLLNGVGPVGATSWLAMPAFSKFNGTITFAANANYGNSWEDDFQLGIYDAAAGGPVVNITRNTGDTGAGMGAPCFGFRTQSKGTYAIDFLIGGVGLHKVGVDLSPMTFTTAKAAHAVPSGGRYYGNASSTDSIKATSYGNDWFERTSTGWSFVFNSVQSLLISDTAVTFLKPPITPVYTVSTLPAGTQGMRALVTDANSTTFLAALVGGGSNKVPAFHDGTGWKIG